MSWLNDLQNFGREIVADLDSISERIGDALADNVAPVLQTAATELDRGISNIVGLSSDNKETSSAGNPSSAENPSADSDAAGQDLGARVKQALIDLDKRYQLFMVSTVDPLFGKTRNQHLKELGSLEISPGEVMLNRQIALAGGALLTLVAGHLLAPFTLALTVPASFIVAWPVFGIAVKSVKKQKRVTYHVVSAISMTAIWLRGLYIPALAATMAYYMGEKLLMVTEDRSHKGLISVFSQQPRTVTQLRDGVEVERPLEDLCAGDIVVVHAGSFMPVDGVVVDGDAAVDQQMLTGEAQPAEKSPGDMVYASTVVLNGKVHVRVDHAGSETVAAKIGDVLNRTASYQLDLQSKGSKIAHDSALPTLLLSGLALGTLGPDSGLAVLNSSFGVNLRMSGPVTMLNLLNIASYNAILLKDGRSLDMLSDVDTVVFDKTGTLTLSRFHVSQVHFAGDISEEKLLTLAAAAELQQSHPIALAILEAARSRNLDIPELDHASYDIGYGVKVRIGNLVVKVGSDRFMARENIEIPKKISEEHDACHTRGHSLVMVAVDDVVAGAIELEPTIRPEAASVIAQLRKRGLSLVVISGDQEEPTRQLATSLGMDRHFANVLPEGKASLVAKLQSEGRVICFVGDGINDSIALKKSNVSVSLRGATTVATDAAQIVLMQESLEKLPCLFELGDEMERSMKLGYAAGMIPGVLTVGGVFFAGWGYFHAIGLSVLSLTTSLGIAMYPMYKHRKELERERRAAQALPKEVQPDPPQPQPAASRQTPAAQAPVAASV